MEAQVQDSSRADTAMHRRWLVLIASIVSMVAVANFQYGWTLFVAPLQRHLRTEQPLIQVTFTVFVLLETWLVPVEGWLVDRFGPRLLVMIGGVLAGLGWIASGYADTLTALYLAYAVAGVGAGIVYGTAIGGALKWFPDRRGLAAGLTAAGFGAGSALTCAPIANMINSAGYQATFIRWGIIQGAVVVLAALLLKSPPPGWLPKNWNDEAGARLRPRQSAVDFTSREMAATSHFWLMYLMMTMVATGGLMATAQLAPMAADYRVDSVPIRLFAWTIPTLTFALAAERVLNGLCRPFWGWISDRIGRENTMTLAFGLEALATYALIHFAHNPFYFVIFSAFTFFGWGEIYSLFPALCGDFFGRKHATANYGFLYTAKGVASVFVPIGSALAAGRAFNFTADAILLMGAVLVLLTLFILPTMFQLQINDAARNFTVAVAVVLVVYGVVLTVVPGLWTPFDVRFALPKGGWPGVFQIAIAFDLTAAVLAYFVLRRMKAPAPPTAQAKAQAFGSWR